MQRMRMILFSGGLLGRQLGGILGGGSLLGHLFFPLPWPRPLPAIRRIMRIPQMKKNYLNIIIPRWTGDATSRLEMKTDESDVCQRLLYPADWHQSTCYITWPPTISWRYNFDQNRWDAYDCDITICHSAYMIYSELLLCLTIFTIAISAFYCTMVFVNVVCFLHRWRDIAFCMFFLKYLLYIIGNAYSGKFAANVDWQFLAPPVERQRIFSNAELSVVRPSVRPPVRPSARQDWGGGESQKRFSNFFSFCWHGASLGWHKSHIEIYIWLKRSKCHFSRSERLNLALIALGGHLLQNGSVTFSILAFFYLVRFWPFSHILTISQSSWIYCHWTIFQLLLQHTTCMAEHRSLVLLVWWHQEQWQWLPVYLLAKYRTTVQSWLCYNRELHTEVGRGVLSNSKQIYLWNFQQYVFGILFVHWRN